MPSEEKGFRSIVEAQFGELHELLHAIGKAEDGGTGGFGPVVAMAEAVVAALRAGKKLLCAGNGGSASDALHMAEELIGRYRSDRLPLPALSLAADATAITCIGNDFGFDHIFSRQVEALGQPGDVLVLFSTSGNSRNLLLAAEAGKKKGLVVLGFLGKDGGKLAPLVDVAWIVPSPNTARIQEFHTWAMHSILEAVEASFPA